MRIKYTLIGILTTIVLFAIWYAKATSQKHHSEEDVNVLHEKGPEPRSSSSSRSSTNRYQLEKVTIKDEEKSNSQTHPVSGFKISPHDTGVHVTDPNGKVLAEIGGNPHFNHGGTKCIPNQSGTRLLVDFGADAYYEVWDLSSLEAKTILPQTPPGPNKLGFSRWRWLDADHLIGESGDDLPGASQTPGEDPPRGRTRLYIYDFKTTALEEVKIPQNLPVDIFRISEVTKSGYIQLSLMDSMDLEHRDLGWFKVDITH